MLTRFLAREFCLLLAFLLSSSPAQLPSKSSTDSLVERPRVVGPEQAFDSTVIFRFDIPNLATNHQFRGQVNTFHVEYEYIGSLKGGDFDPKGHHVNADLFPYFQSVRNEIIEYATNYPNKEDFYELFGVNICHDVLQKFPQIRKVKLAIDIPAYAEVNVDRGRS